MLPGSKIVYTQECGDELWASQENLCAEIEGYNPTLQPTQLPIPPPTPMRDWRLIF